MNCKLYKNLLLLYHEAQLSEPERQQVEAHLQSCEHCRRLSAEIEALLSTPAPKMAAPAGFLFQVHRRLNEAGNSGNQFQRLWKKVALPILKPAALVLMLISSTVIGSWLANEKDDGSADQTMSQQIEEFYPVDVLDAQSEKTLLGAYLSVMEPEK